MKIEWVNNGNEFVLPKINVDMDLEILDYMETLDKDMKSTKKNIMEFRETVYRVLNMVDKNVTKAMITKNLSVNELGSLYVVMRTHGKSKYICPHCKKSFIYDDMPLEGDIPLPERENDTIVTRKDR
jgi:hypothetical protein